ncbi:MAG: CRISPR-associated protein Cas4 [Leptospira sp.]|nr:CRISPR-associated protein Cas4 [Leptospira sp.]
MKSYSIPISLLRQYVFCPRIPFFQLLFPAQNSEKPLWVKQGSEYQEKWESLQKRRSLQRFGISENAKLFFNQYVESDEYGIHGYIDLYVIDYNNCYPIEFKSGNNSFIEGGVLQLTGYLVALGANEKINCNRGFIIFKESKKIIEVQNSIANKSKLKNVIERIRESVDRQILPSSDATLSKCSQCEYLRHCNDRNF